MSSASGVISTETALRRSSSSASSAANAAATAACAASTAIASVIAIWNSSEMLSSSVFPSCPLVTTVLSSNPSAAPPTRFSTPWRFASQHLERKRAASGCGSAIPRIATWPFAEPEMRNWLECETRRRVMGASCVASSLIGCLKSKVHSYTTPTVSAPSIVTRKVPAVTYRQALGVPFLGGSGSGSGSASSSRSSFFSTLGGASTTGTFFSKTYTREATLADTSKVVEVSTSAKVGAEYSMSSPSCP
mmetsp:Transcript_14952/g.36136  ORF Transcript_14952/g.36136 Transcript_14952/m.36136 type:complete len:247 (-) Transcript_14952:1594-2334(-)